MSLFRKSEKLLFVKMNLYTGYMNEKDKMKKIKALYEQVDDYFIKEYFDLDSMKNPDWKIEVLEGLLEGKKPYELEHYDDVLEKYPQKEEFVLGDVQDLFDKL